MNLLGEIQDTILAFPPSMYRIARQKGTKDSIWGNSPRGLFIIFIWEPLTADRPVNAELFLQNAKTAIAIVLLSRHRILPFVTRSIAVAEQGCCESHLA